MMESHSQVYFTNDIYFIQSCVHVQFFNFLFICIGELPSFKYINICRNKDVHTVQQMEASTSMKT